MKPKNIRSLLVVVSSLLLASSGAFAAGACDAKCTAATKLPELSAIPSSTATQPAPRDAKWVKRHEGFVSTVNATQKCDVLFIGDSITDGWRNKDKGALAIWEKNFAQYNPVNLGISGDRTEHVLWRLQNGELGKLQPKAVVLMIGTNNTGFKSDKKTQLNTNAEIADGVTAIVSYLRKNLPDSKILLLAIFPRGGAADNPLRVRVGEVNAIIKGLCDGKMVNYLDIGGKFLDADGTLPKDIMPDALHPNAKGYQIWADAIREPLAKLVN